MAFENPSREEIKSILSESKVIAVVGLSDKPDRVSYMVAEAMQQVGYRIIPVNPVIEASLGEKSYATLAEIPHQYDIVNVFRSSDKVLPIVKEATDLGVKVIWLQQGVYNEEAALYATDKGVTMIMDRCIKVEHAILIGK